MDISDDNWHLQSTPIGFTITHKATGNIRKIAEAPCGALASMSPQVFARRCLYAWTTGHWYDAQKQALQYQLEDLAMNYRHINGDEK